MTKNFTKKMIALLIIAMSMSVNAQFTNPAPAPFVPAQPVFQLPGMPLYTIGAQVRTRGEVRDGLGDPMPKVGTPGTNTNPANPASPSGFISQRTNLNMGFRFDRFNFLMDIRDVRVWGQDAANINNVDGGKTFLHQAWGEFTIATNSDTTKFLNQLLGLDNLSFKVGRQEINYDDARLLGNLDWLQQGRRHDAAILKLTHKGYSFDLGGAFNQNHDAFNNTRSGNSYNAVNTTGYAVGSNGSLMAYPADFVPTNANGTPQVAGFGPTTNGLGQNYKTMFYLYGTRKFNQTKLSVLAFNDNFSKWTNETLTSTNLNNVTAGGDSSYTVNRIAGRRYNKGADVNSRFTVGGQFSTQFGNATGVKINLNGGGYYQFGHNISTKKIDAYHAFFYGAATIKKWSFGFGQEILSGNNIEVTENLTNKANPISTKVLESTDSRFDPLYGTPHRWWGYMDYFYVGTGSPRAGLSNTYVRLRYDRNNFFFTADLHNFMTAFKDVKWRPDANSQYQTLNPIYGQEIDLVANYQVNKFVNLEVGYSVFFATETLAAAKGLAAGKSGYQNINQWGYVQLNFRPEFLYQKPVAIKN